MTTALVRTNPWLCLLISTYLLIQKTNEPTRPNCYCTAQKQRLNKWATLPARPSLPLLAHFLSTIHYLFHFAKNFMIFTLLFISRESWDSQTLSPLYRLYTCHSEVYISVDWGRLQKAIYFKKGIRTPIQMSTWDNNTCPFTAACMLTAGRLGEL